MAAPVATACATHPKRERAAVCGQCGNGVCRDCIVHTGVGIKCRTCTGERAPGSSGRGDGGGRPRWLVPAAIAGAVALVAAVLALRGGGGGGEEATDLPGSDPSQTQGPVERKIVLNGGRGTRIGATLGLPGGPDKPVAGVLIVPGFGAIDRDAVMATTTPDGAADRLSQDVNYSRPGVPDNLFRDLHSAALAKNMATLRYDKRGSAESRLDASQPLDYDDLVTDAVVALDALAQRREVEGSPLAVIGVDQGGLIALRLAADPRVKAVVLVSSFGRPLADVVGDDFIAARGDTGREVSDQLHAIAAGLAAGGPVPPPASMSSHLRPLLPVVQEGYLRAIFGLDPVAEARAVRQPVLLVRGDKDTSTTAVDHERLRAALAPSTEELVFTGGDHNLGERGRRDADTMARLTTWLVNHIR